MSKKIQIKKPIKKKLDKVSAFSTAKVRAVFVPVSESILLYRLVYKTRFSLVLALFLIFSFTIQGVQKAYADEGNLPPVESEVVAETELMTQSETVSPTDAVSTNESLPMEADGTFLEEQENDLALQNPEATTSDILEVEDTLSGVKEEVSSSDTDTDTDTNPNPDTDNSSNEDVSDVDSFETTNTTGTTSASSTDEIYVDDFDSSGEEAALPEVEMTHETVSVNNSDSQFTFNKDECTQLATGSFYCMKAQENFLQDALFSAPDADGDLEIFLVRDGVQVQITNNTLDDAAPYFDANSNTIVWHRLIEDRYQIISYDIESQIETQITNNSENNMEPTRQGKYTVWQRWTGGGWNIILREGSVEKQITHSSSHNVAPYVHGTLVVWNNHTLTGEKTIEMYDIETKTYVTVDDPDGMSVSNPRMVFVYDSLHPNGDIVTKGYDVMSRKFINLDTLPRELPEELPQTDSTGETRALIQTKPSVKSDEVINGGSSPKLSNPPLPNLDNASSTVDAMTIDMSSSTLDVLLVADLLNPTIVDPVLEIPDVVVLPLVSSSTTETVQE
jgi:hypothetical protein